MSAGTGVSTIVAFALLNIVTLPCWAAGILSADRQTVWNPGLNSVGGIPNRTAIYTTISAGTYGNGASDATAAIQAAIDNCPVGQVVQLSAGTFTINNDIIYVNKGITLRGAGANLTTLQRTNGAVPGSGQWNAAKPVVIVGPNRWASQGSGYNLASNAVKGTYSVQLASVPAGGISAGQIVLIDELSGAAWRTDPLGRGQVWASADFRVVYQRHNPPQDFDDPWPESAGWFCRQDRPTCEVKEVQSYNATTRTVTFTTPLHIDYRTANTAQLYTYLSSDTHVKYAGVEDFKVQGGDDGQLRFELAAHCWAARIENTAWLGEGFAIDHSFRVEVRDSYVHDPVVLSPGGGSYNFSLAQGSSEVLIENNISRMVDKVMVSRCSGAGSVVGYNYMDDGIIDYAPTWVEIGLNASHMVGPHHVLFEGNYCFNADSDNTHGNSILHTYFRNHLSGQRRSFTDDGPKRCVGLMATSYWMSFVGNVLGRPGQMSGWVYESQNWDDATIWLLGWDGFSPFPVDPNIVALTFRHGNFDYLTNTQKWDPAVSDHNLPNSLYLSQKPTFFGTNTWPWVDPAAGTVHTLPARVRFEGMNGLPPFIATQPTDATVAAGQPATFSVVATGTAPLSYQWQKNGVNIAGATSLSYTTPATVVADNGATFRCVVSNSAGTTNSNGARLTVTVTSDTTPPTAPANLAAAAASASQINLTWTASTDNVGVTGYQVFRGGMQVGTATTNRYSDTGLLPSTAYSYTVKATDGAGNVSPASGAASATTQAAGGGIDQSILPDIYRTTWDPGIQGGIPADNDPVRPATVWLPAGNPYSGYSVNPALTGTANAATFTAAFQAAINSAGAAATPTSRKIVLLKAGTYFVNQQNGPGGQVGIYVRVDNITIRGEGVQTTRLVANGTINQLGTVVLFGHRSGSSDADFAVQNVTADALKGSKTIQVANASAYVVGDVITIDHLDGAASAVGSVYFNGGYLWTYDGQYFKRAPARDWAGPGTGAQAFPNVTSIASANAAAQNVLPQWRSTVQETEITAINGNTITIRDPLNIDFPLSLSPQVWRTVPLNTASIPVGNRWDGLENIGVAGGNNQWGFPGGTVVLSYMAYSWVKGVDADGERWSSDPVNHPGKYGYNIGLGRCYRCVVRESYSHGATDENPGGQAYGIVVGVGTSASLVENNISINNNKPIALNETGGGNVIAYNYVDQSELWNSPGWLENGIDENHASFTHNDLIEGNWANNIGSDSTHGNSGWHTHLRNYSHGNNLLGGPKSSNLRAVTMTAWTHNLAFIGNVLMGGTVYQTTPSSPNGTPVYQIGFNAAYSDNGGMDDGYALAHIYRDGNWDNVSGAVVWANGVRAIPSSFYLTSKPAFFGSYTWPWVDPTGTTAANRVLTLPAKARYDAGTPFAPPPGGGAMPSITAQPASVTVTAGQTASFSVVATGTTPLVYQWQKNGAAIPGATAASYTTPATVAADNGAQFRVVVTNSLGSATSSSATLTVTAPDTTPPTVALTVPAAGTTVSNTCTVSANAADNVGVVGVQFKLDGANVGAEDLSSPYSVAWDTRSSVNGTHTLTAVARDAAGNTTISAAVTVMVSNTSLTMGETAVVSGEDSGNGNLLVAQQATLPRTATLQSLSFYVTSAAGRLRLGVYDATGPNGGPGTKKAETPEFTPVTGWNTVNVAAPISLAAGNYWLAYLPSDGGLAFRKEVTGAGRYCAYTYGPMPVTFSTSPTVESVHWSLYATLSIDGVVDRPPIAVADNVMTLEDVSVLIDVKANDTDADGDALSVSSVGVPGRGTSVLESGKVRYTPNANYNGVDSFTYVVTDGKGGYATGTVSVTVTAVNDAPVCSVTSPANGATSTAPATIAIQANASDIDGTIAKVEFYQGATKLGEDVTSPYEYAWTSVAAGSYTLTVKATDNSGATTTSAVVNVTVNSSGGPDGYIWCANEGGSYTFTQTVDVAYGAQGKFAYKYGVTGTMVFNNTTFGDPIPGVVKAGYYRIVVTSNNPPVAIAQSVTTAEDTPKAIVLTGSDPDGDPLTFAVVTGPAHGTLSGTAPNVTYTLAANYNGADSFTFKVNDGKTNSAPATVSITVTPVNDLPVIVSCTATPTSGTAPLAVAFAASATDVDGDPLTYVWTFGPSTGSGQATSYTYTNAGTYVATVTVSDGKGGTATASKTITVTGGSGDTDTTDDLLGTIAARGENGTNEGKAKAFDNQTSTKWLDFSPQGSWIQYTYATGISGKLSSYTITSANDAPERDPMDWQLLGSNDGGTTWTTVDSQTGQTFGARFQKRTFTLVGSPTYQAYRLNITKVQNPAGANSVQLAEIELIGQQVLVVNQPPVALAGVDPINGTTLDEFYFWATDSYDPNGKVNSYQWTVNSEEVSTQTEFLYSFPTTGVYNVTLTVWDNKGASDSDLVQVQVTEPSVTVSVEVPDGMAGEPGLPEGSATIRVRRTGSTSAALTVNVALSGDASNGVDYAALANTVVIPAGATYRDVTISPLADASDESDEMVILTVLSGTGYAVDSGASAGLVLIKDQTYGTPVVSAEATDAVAKEPMQTTDKGAIKVSRTGSCNAALTVYCTLGGTAVNGVDYSPVTVPVVLAVGQSSKVLTIAPLADGVVESNETVVLTLTTNAAYQIQSGKGTATVTIQDATVLTTPVVSVVATDADAQEPAGGVLNYGYIRFARTTRFHETLTVNCTVGGTASNGVDYVMVTVPIVFAVGEGIKDVSVRPIADGVAEGVETTMFTLTAGTGYTVDASKASATVSIRE